MAEKKNNNKLFIIVIFFVTVVIAAIIMVTDAAMRIEYENRLALHPKKYSEFVEKYAAEYEIDPDIIYSVIKTESSFDSKAVSEVGARGLMQIMEETFDWIRFRLGDEDTVYDDMFDPEMNIRYGSYLVDYLLEKFGDKDTAIAAYHAGAGCVSGWLTEKENSADGKRLDNIPSSSTAHYVNKINKALGNYKELYSE